MTVEKKITSEEVKALLREHIPTMSVTTTPPTTREGKLKLFVQTGLSDYHKASEKINWTAFKNVSKICSQSYIDARMGSVSVAQDQELKVHYAERVIEEYLDRIVDVSIKRDVFDRRTRNIKNLTARKNTKYEPYRFRLLTFNWMNPENLAAAV